MSFVPELVRQLPLCNRVFTRVLQHRLLSDSSWNLSPAFLWLRLTTEVATGEYRGYGRAGTDDEGMMDVA